ncbi:hypothetical protein HDV06_003952 [Boothiomyces sp. JEL0866]|nr:hypothetical protein HDV06_003952 [Boothiomyces sp. JEL0866]
MIQLVNTWSTLQTRTIENFTWVVSTSTLFYSVCVTSLLYISMQRYLAINHQSTYSEWIRKGTIAMLVVLFLVRVVRTGYVFIQNSGSSVFPIASTLQILTIFPIFVIRMFFDVASLIKLYEHFSSVSLQPSNKRVAFAQLGYSLVVEILLTLLSIYVAYMEAIGYTGDNIAVVDWIMISWAIGALLEQSQILKRLFSDAHSDDLTSKSAHQQSTYVHSQTTRVSIF